MKPEQLFAHFDRIADLPDSMPLLRRFILDLAVQGKLVKQERNDEPAVDLLNRIEVEKDRLVREGKIRKGKPLPPIDVEPYELPSGWKWTRLGNTGRIFNGNSVSESEKEILSRVTKGYPFIATKDVGYGRDRLAYENGIKVPFDAPGFKVAHALAVLICAEGGSAGKKAGLTDRDICFGNKLYANEVWPGIHPRYILSLYQTSAFFKEFAAKITGIIGGIAYSEFQILPVPIPPEGEQHRIVAKIDELMILCDKLEAAQAERENRRERLTAASLHRLNNSIDVAELHKNANFHIDHFVRFTSRPKQIPALRQAILSLAVRGKIVPQNLKDEPVSKLIASIQEERNDLIRLRVLKQRSTKSEYSNNDLPFDLVPTWQWVPLESLIVFGPQNGISPKPSSRPDAPKAITLTATTKGVFDSRYFKHVDASIPQDSELWLRSGDLLFQRGNTREYVGMAAYYPGRANLFLYPDLMMKVRLSEKVNLQYIHICTIAPYARAYFSSHASGAQLTMPKINQGTLVQLPIPLPPFAEQHRIVSKVKELFTLCDQLEVLLTTAQIESRHFLDVVLNQVAGTKLYKVNEKKLGATKRDADIKQQNNVDERKMIQTHALQFTSSNPVKMIAEMIECLNALGGYATPESLLNTTGLGDDVEKFFDLLREGRDSELLSAPTGANQVIRRNNHAD